MSMENSSGPQLRAWHSPAAAITASRNIAEKLLTLTVGRIAVSPLADRLRDAKWRYEPHRSSPHVRAAVVAHAYYPDLVPEILRCHRWLPVDSPLHLTTTEDSRDAVLVAIRDVPGANVHVVPNRGRDIAPFLHVLTSGHLDSADAVLKLHTKRSVHLMDGDVRRRLLYLALAGGPARVHRILTLFEAASTGVVGWGPSFRQGPCFWQRNRARGRELIARMGGLEDTPLGFFEGSMFWVRPSALRRLRALNLTFDNFESELGQTDGALHHAVERMFCISATLDGFNALSTTGKLLRLGSRGELALKPPGR